MLKDAYNSSFPAFYVLLLTLLAIQYQLLFASQMKIYTLLKAFSISSQIMTYRTHLYRVYYLLKFHSYFFLLVDSQSMPSSIYKLFILFFKVLTRLMLCTLCFFSQDHINIFSFYVASYL